MRLLERILSIEMILLSKINNQICRLHEVDFPGSSLAENSCLRAKLQACSNYIHHISTVGSDQLICGSYYAQPKCEYRNTYFEAHNFISDGSSATNGFVKTLGRDSSFLGRVLFIENNFCGHKSLTKYRTLSRYGGSRSRVHPSCF